jgi:hypothetical protein
MKYLLILFFSLTVIACVEQDHASDFAVNPGDGVIYGDDSVRNIKERAIQDNDGFSVNARASAALINLSDVINTKNGKYYLNDKTVAERFGTCDDFKLSSQIAAAYCSSVLIGPNKILTAAHWTKKMYIAAKMLSR